MPFFFPTFLLPDKEHATNNSHVHFDQSIIRDDFESDNSIIYHKSSKNNIVVHLGFLQVKHRYKIELKIPADTFEVPDNEELRLAVDEEEVPNINCRMLEYHGKCDTNLTFGKTFFGLFGLESSFKGTGAGRVEFEKI
jgi:Domain of unknown function (DUF4517)